MDSARVYKIKIRENILRQIIFTDRNVFFGIATIIVLIVWKGMSAFPNDIKIFTSLMISGIVLLIFTIKMDRQLLIKLLPRIINFWQRKKKLRY
jgi:hypothetical protein